MNVVDSSAWLEYLADTPAAATFATAIEDSDNLLVPSVCVAEILRRTLSDRGEEAAVSVLAALRTGRIVPLDDSLAEQAARAGLRNKLPMVDSIIIATAQAFDADLWTQDSHFRGLPGVRYFPKGRS